MMNAETRIFFVFFQFSLYVQFFPPSVAARWQCPSTGNSTWVRFKSSCYTALQTSLKTSYNNEDARDLCKAIGSNVGIVIINNQEENRFIVDYSKKIWEGKDIWLGMFFDIDYNTLRWYDNSELTYSNWSNEEHINENADTCAVMHTKSGQWEKVSCEYPGARILCETSASTAQVYATEAQVSTTIFLM
ncbi:CD302 antigen isoform X2 [Latimeria chalumnae]|uniref:CD302 antigen isoform X2 n=1 Tax=Latimeria chalumnae TaxID=7897 RepID=UPI0003C1072A|nr:PREDICTED: CD302 antigen isoform X1 [Latimeria chalumnae]|eukprot:XP_006011084.1 PREDICTED: CD302 antigen isoform X1 [Latimeria chalumnae]